MELVEFLLARIAEDEAAARCPLPGDWNVEDGRVLASKAVVAEDWHGTAYRPVSEHIARHDPARVLAECDAKRRIVAAYLDERTRRDIYWAADEADLNDDDRHRRHAATARTRGLEIAVEALVLPYADHPDDRSWSPDV